MSERDRRDAALVVSEAQLHGALEAISEGRYIAAATAARIAYHALRDAADANIRVAAACRELET